MSLPDKVGANNFDVPKSANLAQTWLGSRLKSKTFGERTSRCTIAGVKECMYPNPLATSSATRTLKEGLLTAFGRMSERGLVDKTGEREWEDGESWGG
eukprot:CAMPEP_0201531400 /NCGR_PEP_ID=MMETSP0161_2-20130828/47508_1 /ASSEMBLY_ACC=CAM_ASM_000251 /TAXON_ID=180227 /ORGANISM="Neoparamoeba aestuarina, Strain SoJaBio B1-5/56/2" /LENGTH=97 /DNA_ID=CAMNT_0047934295 /DNA_START=299 /DNA_END=588 /DNA_ORIENTATION=-